MLGTGLKSLRQIYRKFKHTMDVFFPKNQTCPTVSILSIPHDPHAQNPEFVKRIFRMFPNFDMELSDKTGDERLPACGRILPPQPITQAKLCGKRVRVWMTRMRNTKLWQKS